MYCADNVIGGEMTTLQQLAVDVFSEGAEYGYGGDLLIIWTGENVPSGITLTDFEVAQLNDIACEMFEKEEYMSGRWGADTKDKEVATELEWLMYFFVVADFGPADDDVRHIIEQSFIKTTGKALPVGYGREEG